MQGNVLLIKKLFIYIFHLQTQIFNDWNKKWLYTIPSCYHFTSSPTYPQNLRSKENQGWELLVYTMTLDKIAKVCYILYENPTLRSQISVLQKTAHSKYWTENNFKCSSWLQSHIWILTTNLVESSKLGRMVGGVDLKPTRHSLCEGLMIRAVIPWSYLARMKQLLWLVSSMGLHEISLALEKYPMLAIIQSQKY